MTRKTNFPTVPIKQVLETMTENGQKGYRPVVLVVDDESAIADTLAEILSRSGYAAVPVYDAESALDSALLMPPEMLIADVMLPGESGIDLAIKIRRIFPDCRILLFSGQAATSDLLVSANRAGHKFELIAKPVHPKELLAWAAGSAKKQSPREAVYTA
ncbi:MAG: response regulator [Terracidiphilus sp.]|jgi:DNA-binding response OmpR family regulator